MTSETIKKITQKRTYLDATEISAEEKKRLSAFLIEKGFTLSTFYLRFFQKGFDEWELLGIKNCKNQFLELPDVAQRLLDYVNPDDPHALPGDKGYFYMLAHSDVPGVFYQCLKQVNGGLCNKFFSFMGAYGMSVGTVIKRFTTDDWKPWENDGIIAVLNEYIDKN